MMKQIQLNQGLVTLVDDQDFEWLLQWKWTAAWMGRNQTHAYVYRPERAEGKQSNIRMHRQILGFPACGVDHWNRNTLDNQRENLRLATQSQNNLNRIGIGKSGFKGVFFHPHSGLWMARIAFEHKDYFLGYFKDPKDAARAYDSKAFELGGQFSLLNFPPEQTHNPSNYAK